LKLRVLFLALPLACVLWSGTVVRAAAPPTALIWAAGPEQPESGNQAAEERHELYFKIINFALLVAALGYFARKPMAEFFSQRSEGIRKALGEGKSALEKSQAQFSAVEEKLSRLEQEIAAFKAAAEKEMEAERKRLAEGAGHEAEKILETARVRMDSAVRAARLELKAFTAQRALELAEQMIHERLDEAGGARLVGQFIAGLSAGEKRA
jgi:F-type H+-transporting ATPase subunit b